MPSKTGFQKAMEAEQAKQGEQPTEWISIATAAKRCEVSTRTVRRWIAYGEVRARRFGPKLIRIDAATLNTMGEDVVWAGTMAS